MYLPREDTFYKERFSVGYIIGQGEWIRSQFGFHQPFRDRINITLGLGGGVLGRPLVYRRR